VQENLHATPILLLLWEQELKKQEKESSLRQATGAPIRARVFAFLAKERRLAALFRIPSKLAAPRRSPPASQVANLAGAVRRFAQEEFPSSPAWEFPGQMDLLLGQPRNLIGQICSFVKGLDCPVAQRHALPPFASAQA